MEHDSLVKRAIDSFLRQGFSRHHTESYEHFVRYQLHDIILEFNPIVVAVPNRKILHYVTFDHIHIQRPIITEGNHTISSCSPLVAHLRKQTYCRCICGYYA